MERVTSCKVELELFDTTAISDSNFTVSNIQRFSNINSIKNKSQEIVRIATCENDYFLLDGSYQLYDDVNDLSSKIGYMSSEFKTVIKSAFGSNHSSAGITFHFYETIPNYIKIYFGNDESYVARKEFYPKFEDFTVIKREGYTEYTYFASIGAEDYNYMEVELSSPDRYIRLNSIDYGVSLIYGDEYKKKVKSCSLTEETDILSTALTVNECKVELVDSDYLFDITNPKSYYKYLQKRQKFKIIERINDEERLMAFHYLKEWTQTKSMLASFTLQDIVGLMSDTTFYGGMYSNISAKELIDTVMSDYGFNDYQIDENIQNIYLSGYLKVMSHREALQQIAFACGACIDTSRITGIRIFKPTLDNIGMIDTDRKLISKAHEVKQNDLVTGVSINTHSYALKEEITEVYKGNHEVGKYKAIFNNPCANLSITGGTILSSNCNSADIDVTVAGTVIIKGNTYEDNGVAHIYKVSELPSATDENIVSIEQATLVTNINVDDLTEYVYKLEQYRIKHELKIITVNEQVAQMLALRTNGLYVPILITKMTTDLTGGYISSIEGIGYALRIDDYYRTGTELYTGSEALI